MDFSLLLGARGAERKGLYREKWVQNLPTGGRCEVHRFPQEYAETRGNRCEQTRKNPNSDELGFLYWW